MNAFIHSCDLLSFSIFEILEIVINTKERLKI